MGQMENRRASKCHVRDVVPCKLLSLNSLRYNEASGCLVQVFRNFSEGLIRHRKVEHPRRRLFGELEDFPRIGMAVGSVRAPHAPVVAEKRPIEVRRPFHHVGQNARAVADVVFDREKVG